LPPAAHVSGCQHEEYGESSGSVTRTPHRRPAPWPGAHGGPAGQVATPGAMRERDGPRSRKGGGTL